jgi:hypothetical protein
MTRGSTPVATLLFTTIALACWTMMFFAATDIWHETGRADLSRIPGMHAADLRAFAIAFYALPVVLLAQFATTAVGFVRARLAAARA